MPKAKESICELRDAGGELVGWTVVPSPPDVLLRPDEAGQLHAYVLDLHHPALLRYYRASFGWVTSVIAPAVSDAGEEEVGEEPRDPPPAPR